MHRAGRSLGGPSLGGSPTSRVNRLHSSSYSSIKITQAHPCDAQWDQQNLRKHCLILSYNAYRQLMHTAYVPPSNPTVHPYDVRTSGSSPLPVFHVNLLYDVHAGNCAVWTLPHILAHVDDGSSHACRIAFAKELYEHEAGCLLEKISLPQAWI